MSNALRTAPTYFRSNVIRKVKPKKVDRENNSINGFAVITKGEALGHGMWVDASFLKAIVEQSSELGTLKSRFTHPGLSSDAMGSFLGKVSNLSLDGEIVRGNLKLAESAAKSPKGDLREYVLTLAEEDPDEFGASIVFTRDVDAEQAFREEFTEELNIDGEIMSVFKSPDPDNKKNLSHARLKKIRAVDIVDEPAANPGGFFHDGEELAWRADIALKFLTGISLETPDEIIMGMDPSRIKTYFDKFLDRHGLIVVTSKKEDVDMSTTQNQPVNTPAFKAASLAELELRFGEDNPDFVLGCLRSSFSIEQAESKWSEHQAELLSAENKVLKGQLITMTSERDALSKRLGISEKRQETGFDFSPSEKTDHEKALEASQDEDDAEEYDEMLPEEQYAIDWKKSAKTRRDFGGDEKDYIAYRKHSDKGLVEILERPVQR